MPATEPQLDRIQQHLHARFREMGLSARPMSDGRTLLVSLPISPAPFDSANGPLRIERVIFSTVGNGQIKCLRPSPLFSLPLLEIRDVKDARGIESVIRRAHRERARDLQEATRWLDTMGIDVSPDQAGTALSFPIPGEAPEAQFRMSNRQEVILPSVGPLTGCPLDACRERIVSIPKALNQGADLESLLAAQIDDLRRRARKREAAERNRGPASFGAAQRKPTAAPLPLCASDSAAPAVAAPHSPKVLLVGQRLIENRALRSALATRGIRCATARSEPEALARLASMTPDLVLSEFGLGRSDGAAFVQTTRTIAGIENIPIVLLDELAHAARRDAARAVGAAGYVIGPANPARFVARLDKLLEAPGKRRYTRYPERLDARLQGTTAQCVATEVGRGGVFIATDIDIDLHSAMQCEIALPHLGREVRFEGEVLYRSESQAQMRGLGLRLTDISPEDEACLIEFVTQLESKR